MRGSQQHSGRHGKSRGRARGWASRNRDQLARDVFAGLLVAGIPAAIGILLSTGRLAGASNAAWITVLVAAIAFVAGLLIARRLQPPSAHSQHSDDGEVKKLSAYVESFASAFHRLLLGELDDVEAELLIRPARLIERLTGGIVQLAVFVPVEAKDREGYWHLAYGAGVSRRECREFEVALKDSYLARMQARWGPRDEVLVVPDLQEQRWRKAGADFEAFAQAGCRMLRCFPFGFADAQGKSRPCIVLLSKDPGPFSGFDDLYLILLGFLFSVQAVIAERARLTSEHRETTE